MKSYSPSEIVDIFEHELSNIQLADEPQQLYSPIRYTMAEGGKRMRPVMTALAYNMYDDNLSNVWSAALAIEVFHNFTLLHDDIMDNAAMRRGRESVYAKWGTNVAILSGDVMLIEAYHLLQGVSQEHLANVLTLFNTMARQVCEGQQYDMDFEQRDRVSVAEYVQMIELKTAALFAGAVTIGATLANAPKEDCLKLHRFATEVGLAFQIQDDLLDSYGDAQLGKKIGGDILEGKQTYLMITALSNADEKEREVLRKTHLRTDIDDAEKIEIIRALYDKLDIPNKAERQIEVRIARALAILETLSIKSDRTLQMQEYVIGLVGRKR